MPGAALADRNLAGSGGRAETLGDVRKSGFFRLADALEVLLLVMTTSLLVPLFAVGDASAMDWATAETRWTRSPDWRRSPPQSVHRGMEAHQGEGRRRVPIRPPLMRQ